jgi:N-acetylglucosaminyl-diphospho-decaprenol L-rhamnosyltransferase
LSVVSHGQNRLLAGLLGDLARHPPLAEGIITENRADTAGLTVPPALATWTRVRNRRPLGFADNHNRAFADCAQAWFCVINPDIRLPEDPFPALLACMAADPTVGVCAPLVRNTRGGLEDSARYFPRVGDLLRKAWRGDDGRYPLDPERPTAVDWTAGMFLLIRAQAFAAIGGFDPRFHLYYEDVDLCARMWRAGWQVMIHPGVHVVHDARRASRRDLQYMRWHAASVARYLLKHRGGASR